MQDKLHNWGKTANFIFIDWLIPGIELTRQIRRKYGEKIIVIVISAILRGKRILMAEDVEINYEIETAMLEETGVEIVAVENGAVAVDLFSSDPMSYDLILMDIHMPKVDGYEATRRIRRMQSPNAKTIPIVAMTANVFKEDIERCLAAGMNAHLAKPIDMEEVMNTLVKQLL